MVPSSFYQHDPRLPKTERAKRVYESITDLVESKKARPEDFSLRAIGIGMGLFDPIDPVHSFREACDWMSRNNISTLNVNNTDGIFQESNPGLLAGAFALLATTLLSTKVIDAYNSAEGMVADELVDHQTSNHRFTKVAGVTALTGGAKVADGHPYPLTDFSTKWVQTFEEKYGRMLEISELAIQEDNTGLILRQAATLGDLLRQSREIDMINQITDQNTLTYYPSGSATALYSATNQNLIGTSGVTGYTSAIALQDWTDINEVRTMRATKVVDDRIDGTAHPIAGLNGRATVLVPQALWATAEYIRTATTVKTAPGVTSGYSTEFANPVANSFDVKSSVYLDALSASTWYYGQFKKTFLYTEIFPLQTFVQGASSDAQFERDVGMRVKVRYLGGLNAVDPLYVTKVLGA